MEITKKIVENTRKMHSIYTLKIRVRNLYFVILRYRKHDLPLIIYENQIVIAREH